MNTREEIVEEAIRDLKAYVRESKKETNELENAIRVLENDQESAKADGSLDAKISQLTKLLIAKIGSSTAKENLLVSKVELLAALITPQKVYDHWDIMTSQEGNVEEDIRTLKKEIDDLTIAIRTLETDQQSAEADGSLDSKISKLTALLIAKITFLVAEQNLLTAKLEHVTVLITSPQVRARWDGTTSQEKEEIRAMKKEIGDLEIAISALEIDQQSVEADGSLDTQISRLTKQLSENMDSLSSVIELMSSKIGLLTSEQKLFNFIARTKGRTPSKVPSTPMKTMTRLAYEGWESIVEEKKRELKGFIQESKKEDCNLEAASQKLERDVESAIAVGLPRTIMYQKMSLVSAKWFSSRAKKDLWNALSKLLNAHNEFQKVYLTPFNEDNNTFSLLTYPLKVISSIGSSLWGQLISVWQGVYPNKRPSSTLSSSSSSDVNHNEVELMEWKKSHN